MSVVEPASTTSVKGFDVWSPLRAGPLAAAVRAGYVFAVRYVDNLEPQEIDDLLEAGLALMLVQAAPRSYAAGRGTIDGQRAAAQARALGIPAGINLFSDLENTAGSSPDAVVAYSNAWFEAVQQAGYLPGLYVGTSMFSSTDLEQRFRYAHYWMAGLAGIPFVDRRGYQLFQHGQDELDGLVVDVDIAQTDLLGGRLAWLRSGPGAPSEREPTSKVARAG